MSFFDEKCSCGASRWWVDSLLFLFWLAGSAAMPLVLGANFRAASIQWLLTPVMIIISLLLYRKNMDLFFFGSFASVILVLIGFMIKVLVSR